MSAKLDSGALTTIIAAETAATNPAYAGGVSRILKVLTPGGQHIGIVHEITMADGTTPHSHPKDYTRRDCSRVRLASEPQT